MKIAILGFGSQGAAALEYWASPENEITVCDTNTELKLPETVQAKLGANYLQGLDEFDLIVRSPSIHPRDIYKASPGVEDKITTVTNEFFKVCPTKNIIGVTGTKGKGTTSTLITKMLEAAGKQVHLGGNIGTPPLEMLKNNIEPDDWVVLELANFQLIDLKCSPHIAVCLGVIPEHLDWHTDLEEYIETKQQLFKNQANHDFAIYYTENENSRRIASISPGIKIPFLARPGATVENDSVIIEENTICKTNEIGLIGKHNWQNVCAAITAVWQVEKNLEAIKKAIMTVKNLPFRTELRDEIDGVKFYNDSFATAPDASVAAIEAVQEHKVIILGGHDRGLSLEKLAETIKRHEHDIRKVVIIGIAGPRLSEALEAEGYDNYIIESSRDMETVVRTARSYAHRGDAILLSPGFASFDMFKNFQERGEKFNEAIESS